MAGPSERDQGAQRSAPAVSEFLDLTAVENAYKWLDERWEHPIPPWAGEDYRIMLGCLRTGELRPAVCMLPADERPSADDIMMMVSELRETFKEKVAPPPPPVEPPLRDATPRDLAKPEHVSTVVEEANRALGR